MAFAVFGLPGLVGSLRPVEFVGSSIVGIWIVWGAGRGGSGFVGTTRNAPDRVGSQWRVERGSAWVSEASNSTVLGRRSRHCTTASLRMLETAARWQAHWAVFPIGCRPWAKLVACGSFGFFVRRWQHPCQPCPRPIEATFGGRIEWWNPCPSLIQKNTTSGELHAEIAERIRERPGVIQPEKIGQTLEGRPIWAFHLSDPRQPVTRKVLITSKYTRIEWMGTEVAVDLIAELSAQPEPGVQVTIVPVINVDGRLRVEADLLAGRNMY